MSVRIRWQLLLVAFYVLPIHGGAAEIDPARKVALTRVPNGGIQPQVAVDATGAVHMVYYKGDPGHGDLYYVRSRDGATFSTPMQVNSQPGAAVAAGNIRGAHIALGKTLGKNVRVHVAWNGSHAPTGKMGKEPMWYARIDDAGTAFEPERNVIQMAYGLDGGGSLAADTAGNVYVVWHAASPGTEGEGNRRVWIARSTDDGANFECERPVWDRATGACGAAASTPSPTARARCTCSTARPPKWCTVTYT
jgi:hypothetical protein